MIIKGEWFEFLQNKGEHIKGVIREMLHTGFRESCYKVWQSFSLSAVSKPHFHNSFSAAARVSGSQHNVNAVDTARDEDAHGQSPWMAVRVLLPIHITGKKGIFLPVFPSDRPEQNFMGHGEPYTFALQEFFLLLNFKDVLQTIYGLDSCR